MDTTIHIADGLAHRLGLETLLKQAPRTRQDEDGDETLVEDRRDALRPNEHVEHKLMSMLQASVLRISHLQKDVRPVAPSARVAK